MAYRARWTMALVGLLTGCRAIASYPYAEARIDGGALDGRADGVAQDGRRDVSPRDGRRDVSPRERVFPENSVPDAQIDDAPADVVPLSPDGVSSDGVSSDMARPTDLPGVLQLPLPPTPDCSAHWCWANPNPQGNALHDVFCLPPKLVAGDGECFAVGDGGTLLHRSTGGVWTLLESGTNRDLNAIWVDADTHRIVVAGREGLIRVWKNNGHGGIDWDEIQISVSGPHPNFVALWGKAGGAVTVGADGLKASPLGIWRWSQGSFTLQGSWKRIDSTVAVHAFWGDAKGTIYAATSDGVKMMDSTMTSGPTPYACAGTSLRDLVGIGSGTPQKLLVLGTNNDVHEVVTSSSCSPIMNVLAGSTAQAIWGTSAKDFYVASGLADAPGYIGHYLNKTSATAYPVRTDFTMTAIASSGSSGRPIAVGKVGEIWELLGSGTWDSRVARVAEEKTLATLGEADALYAGGEGGMLLKLDSGVTWAKWTPSPAVGLDPIVGLSGRKAGSGGSPPAELWAVNKQMSLLKLVPKQGSATSSSGLRKLSALQDFVKGSDHRIIVGGDQGLATYYPSTQHWRTVSSLPGLSGGQTITSLWSPNGQNLYFVAGSSSPDRLYHFLFGSPKATPEQPFGSNTDSVLRVVGTASTVYALGRGQVASKSTTQAGAQWASILPMPSGIGSRAIWGLAQAPNNDLWAVGENGLVIHHFSGNPGWELDPSRCRQQLRDVVVYASAHTAGTQTKRAWAVGKKGAILYRTLP